MWERGAGLTLACGSGACAALVNAYRRGLTGRSAMVAMDGGELLIGWNEMGHVTMRGPAETSFVGVLRRGLMALSGFFGRLKSGLSRSAAKLTDGITATYTKRKLDDAALEELEDQLIAADLVSTWRPGDPRFPQHPLRPGSHRSGDQRDPGG